MNANADNDAKLEGLSVEEFDEQVRELALKKLVPHAGERILVIGFGARHSQAEVARAVGPGGIALEFDLSKHAQGWCGNTILLPHEADSLDGIFTSYTLERFTALPLSALLAECKRVLRPGGRIVVIGLSSEREDESEAGPPNLRQAATAAGFVIKEAERRNMWTPIEIVVAEKGTGPGAG